MLLIAPHTAPKAFGTNIVIRGNRFFDSQLPGLEGCDFGQDLCRTRQRHHILVPRVDGLWVEHNQRSGGGRIKSGGGGLGRNMHITNNSLQFVNDNAITIVDTVAGVTEHVEIAGNTIENPVSFGIFFGADGEEAGLTEGMVLRDIVITGNHVSGFFASGGIIGQLPPTAEDITIGDNVVINVRQTDIPIGSFFAAGMILTQQGADAAPATTISLSGNSVIASGRHSVLNLGGILVRTANRFTDLTLSDNDIDCNDCGYGLAAGIWLWSGRFDAVTVARNRIANASHALQLGAPATFTNVVIDGNTLSGSWHPSRGQITLQAFPGDEISARIANNIVVDGQGYGILCDGSGAFALTDLTTNTFINNALDNGCQ